MLFIHSIEAIHKGGVLAVFEAVPSLMDTTKPSANLYDVQYYVRFWARVWAMRMGYAR